MTLVTSESLSFLHIHESVVSTVLTAVVSIFFASLYHSHAPFTKQSFARVRLYLTKRPYDRSARSD